MIERTPRIKGTALNAATINLEKVTTLEEFAAYVKVPKDVLSDAIRKAPLRGRIPCKLYDPVKGDDVKSFTETHTDWKLIYEDDGKSGLLVAAPSGGILTKPGTISKDNCDFKVCWGNTGNNCLVLNMLRVGPEEMKNLISGLGISNLQIKQALAAKTRTILE